MTFPKLINHSQALKLVLQQLDDSVLGTEVLSLNQASGRILAREVTAPMDVPAFDCSRMDGYAINLHHLPISEQTFIYRLTLGKAIHAKAQSKIGLCTDQAIPIMTGGMLPSDANAIVLKEHAIIENQQLQFSELPSKGQYIRSIGSDVKHGQVVIKSGQRLRAAHLGLLSSLGYSQVEVMLRPKVALMMTGDELIQPGSPCLPGQVYDANTAMLSTLLIDMGCEVSALESLKDTKTAVTQRLLLIKKQDYDVVISVGGVSMGDKDWVPTVLQQQGEVVFHKIRIKPGFPMLFGRLGRALFYGLPGNPVSAYATLCQYVFPAIKTLKNQISHNLTWRASLSHGLLKTHDRREYLRGYFVTGSQGQIEVTVCGGQQSSRIESLADANCFVILDEAQYDLSAGDGVKIQPFLQFKD